MLKVNFHDGRFLLDPCDFNNFDCRNELIVAIFKFINTQKKKKNNDNKKIYAESGKMEIVCRRSENFLEQREKGVDEK